MSLSSAYLDAFFEVARQKSFSKAAKSLAVTQSALSQRVANLEDELGTTLFIRESSGIRLTMLGEELVQYCASRSSLENECLARIRNAHSDSMTGTIRIGAYSTVMRSIVLPSVGDFLVKHPDVRFEMASREMRELPTSLRIGEVDFIFLDHALAKDRVESRLIGHEKYVLIESSTQQIKSDVYLDHDAEDETTSRFFQIQKNKPETLTRSFLDEIYSIIDGVALGLGRAVVPLHIIQDDKRVRRVPKLEPLEIPVYLCHYRQSVYTSLQKEIIVWLENRPRELLRKDQI